MAFKLLNFWTKNNNPANYWVINSRATFKSLENAQEQIQFVVADISAYTQTGFIKTAYPK